MTESRTDTEPKTTLAEQLKRLRLAKGHMTARGFAKALGISENRYSRYERGEAVPKLDLVRSICAELGITPNELYGWEPHDDSDDATRAPSPGATPGPGFGEAGGSANLSPPSAPDRRATTAASVHRGSTPAPLDLAAWRLAAVLAGLADAASATANDPHGRLRGMRATAVVFLQLRTDPFEALARFLQSPEIAAQSADVEARLASEVQLYLAALDTAAR